MAGDAFWVLSTFLRLISHVLKPYIGKYFDDILVFSKGAEKHLSHLGAGLTALRDHKLYLNLKKNGSFSLINYYFWALWLVSREFKQMDRNLRLFGVVLLQNQFMMREVFMGLPHFIGGLSKISVL